MISKSEFLSRVKTEIFPKLDEQKFRRLKMWRNICLVLYGAVVTVIGFKAGFQFFSNLSDGRLRIFAVSIFLFPLLICIFLDEYGNEKRIQTKKNLFKMLDLSQTDFYGIRLDNEDYFSEKNKKIIEEKNNIFEKSALFKQILKETFFSYEDSFVFNSNMACFETERSVLSRQRKSLTFFMGLFIEIKQRQFYNEPIVFAKKGFFSGRKGLKKVQLPRPDKYFDIYSNDASKAQSLYHQQVANKLLQIKDDFKVSKVEASFYQDKLYIALTTNKNLFEPIRKSFLDINQYGMFYDEIAEIEKYCKQFVDL